MLTRSTPMKRGGFKAKAPERREAKQVQYVARPREVATAAVQLPMAQPVLKDSRHESEAWRRAVAALPCVLCRREGGTQAAHRNEGKGMALKTDDALTAALCTACHSAIDQGKDFTREERRQRLDLAILLTIRALARAGKLRIAA
jgi:putative hemolysin